MKLIKDYARLILFAAGILLGVQVPNFIDQYAKRISAHYLEATANFSGYQLTADKHFGGNVRALLEHYGSSADTVFKDDAENIQRIYQRREEFAAERKALQGSLARKIFHMLFFAHKEVFNETLVEFSYTVPLTPEAILCGLILGLILSLLFDLSGHLIARLYGAATGKRAGYHASRRVPGRS